MRPQLRFIGPFASVEAFIPREAITVILSERGWIRAAKGKVEDPSELKFKEGDSLAFLVPGYTTDKLLVAASDGRILRSGPTNWLQAGVTAGAAADDRPRRKGRHRILAHQPGGKLRRIKAGYGFIAPKTNCWPRRGQAGLNGEMLADDPHHGDRDGPRQGRPSCRTTSRAVADVAVFDGAWPNGSTAATARFGPTGGLAGQAGQAGSRDRSGSSVSLNHPAGRRRPAS
jgi:hypothetical protein